MKMLQRYPRNEIEETIDKLTEHYPKTFFLKPKQRVPLSQTILKELRDDAFPAAQELIEASLDWYTSHIGYKGYTMSRAGSPRINLRGEYAGSVTETEARTAQIKLKQYHEEQNEARARLADVVLPAARPVVKILQDVAAPAPPPLAAAVIAAPTPQKVCTTPGCGKPLLAKGLCSQCYFKSRKNLRSNPKPPKSKCSEPGCERVGVVRGLCRKHYQLQWKDRLKQPKKDDMTTTTNTIPSELQRLNELVSNVNSLFAASSDPVLKSTIVRLAIDELMREAKSVIDALAPVR
jgi:hypothetical protein